MAENLDLSRLNILLVEDNQFMTQILKNVLRAFGVGSIRNAADGADALSILKSFEADIVISDWKMEPLDGVELTRLIRTASDLRDNTVPIIMVTGHTELNRILEARDAGVTEIVRKPVSAKALLSRIEEVIKRPRIFVKSRGYIGPDRRRRPKPDGMEQERRSQEPQNILDSTQLSQEEVNALMAPPEED